MTPPDALSPKLLLRARISDRRAETALNQHQVGDHCVDHGQKREPVEDDNRWNGFESARGGGAAKLYTFRRAMPSKRSASRPLSFGGYPLTALAPLQKASAHQPFSAAASHSCVLVQPMDLRAPRSMTCAPPPKASRRGREHVRAYYAGIRIMPHGPPVDEKHRLGILPDQPKIIRCG